MKLFFEGFLDESRIESVLKNFIKENKINLNTIHLLPHDENRALRDLLSKRLKLADIDLSFKSVFLPYFGIKVGGNRDAISWDFINGLCRRNWTKIDPSDLPDIKINSIYKRDKFGCPVKTNITNFKDIQIVNNTRHQGIGSMSSIIETNTDVYKDKKNNILINTTSMVWD